MNKILLGFLALLSGFLSSVAVANESASTPKTVTVDQFVRAETDTYFNRFAKMGNLGKVFHRRRPASIKNQTVIRMNRDTLYSSVLLDLAEPATIRMPDAHGRYQSMHAINQDHTTFMVEHDAGRYTLTKEAAGTRYAFVIIRTFMDPNDRQDIKRANALQNEISVDQKDVGKVEIPVWDQASLTKIRNALLVLGEALPKGAKIFDPKNERDPIFFLIGTALGWGGLPSEAAKYVSYTPEDAGGAPHSVTVKDVPVDGFWSVTLYDETGYIPENALGRYSYNNITSEKNADGSTTIHFGGCDDGRVNCLPITEGWNVTMRMYQPREEILDGRWTFPKPVSVSE